MHCPRCGQQQVSAEVRFCSRCGFRLDGVKDLLANDGVPASGPDEPQAQVAPSPKRKGVNQGIMMMMLGSIIVPILGILASHTPNPNAQMLTALAAVIFFVGGVMRILYAAFFEQGASAGQKVYVPETPPELKAAPRAKALPPQQSIPVSDFARRRTSTAELVPPPSVTENTTRLLDEDKAR